MRTVSTLPLSRQLMKISADISTGQRLSNWSPAMASGALTAMSLIPAVHGTVTNSVTRGPAQLTTAGLGLMTLANMYGARKRDLADLEKAEADEIMQSLLAAQKARRAQKPSRKGWFGQDLAEDDLSKAAAATLGPGSILPRVGSAWEPRLVAIGRTLQLARRSRG